MLQRVSWFLGLMLLLGPWSLPMAADAAPALGRITGAAGTGAAGDDDPEWPPLGNIDPPSLPGIPRGLPFLASGDSDFPLEDLAKPGLATGGFKAYFSGVGIEADHLRCFRELWPDTTIAVLRSADLMPGDAGPAGGRVRLDSRFAEDDQIAWRGRFYPTQVVVTRLPTSPEHPQVAGFSMVLDGLGPFAGMVVREDQSDTYLQGWAGRAVLTFDAEVVEGAYLGIGKPRMRRMVLDGRPAAAGLTKRKATIQRLKRSLTPPVDDRRLRIDEIASRTRANQFLLNFNAEGKLSGFSATGGTETYGDDLLQGLSDPRSRGSATTGLRTP